MKDVLENKLTMFEAVVTLLDSNTAKLASLTALTPAINSFKDFILSIKDKEIQRDNAAAGNANAKAVDKETLVADTLIIASALSAFAGATANDKIKAIAHVTKSSLQNMRDTELVNTATNIKNQADSFAADLAGYGITAPMIAALETKVTKFNTSLGVREQGAAVKVSAGQQLDSLFDQADEMLKDQIDKTMEIFRTSDPQFYGEYKNSREIKDLGHRFDKPVTPVTPG